MIVHREKDLISVEFYRLHPSNLTIEALGGLVATEIIWEIQLEPESSFGFNIMRNNLF